MRIYPATIQLKLIVFSLATFCTVQAWSQSVEQIKADRETYLWGEGTGTTLKRADDEALADLISQISVVVSSSFENEVNETKTVVEGEKSAEFQQKVTGIIRTYSQSALTNTDRIVISQEPDARVLRFIRRDDVSKVFEERRAKIFDYVKVAEEHEENARLGDALRYYNWALALLRSHPDARSIPSEREGASAFMQPYISERINAILEAVEFRTVQIRDEDGQREVILSCMANERPVKNLDFVFWYGTDWSRLHSVKDGRTLIEFYGENAVSWEKTNLKIEYAYSEQLFGDRELEEIYQRMEPAFFAKASREVEFGERQVSQRQAFKSGSEEEERLPAVRHELETLETDEFKPLVDELVRAARDGSVESVVRLFNADGLATYEKLLLYGKARLVDDSAFEVYRHNDEYIARGVYMSFDFQNGRKSFVEEVVFQMSDEMKVTDISFGLGEIAVDDIYNHPNWTEEQKYVLVSFLEHYKTAFALKRLDYVERVFDDNAVIITGTVLKKKQPLDGRQSSNLFAENPIVKYNQFKKKDYLRRLEHVFASKEFINLEFEDNTIRQSQANPKLFGIQIKQNYTSSNYSDQGYLFLLVDFTLPDEPTIHVRTWQPEKDQDGRIYGIEDF